MVDRQKLSFAARMLRSQNSLACLLRFVAALGEHQMSRGLGLLILGSAHSQRSWVVSQTEGASPIEAPSFPDRLVDAANAAQLEMKSDAAQIVMHLSAVKLAAGCQGPERRQHAAALHKTHLYAVPAAVHLMNLQPYHHPSKRKMHRGQPQDLAQHAATLAQHLPRA